MTQAQKPDGKSSSTRRSPVSESSDDAPVAIAKRVVGEVALGASNRIWMLLSAGLMAFASVFLLIGWQFGPLVLIRAAEYRKFTGHVEARIVESWLALEFDASSVRVPANWRASTNAAGCVVAEYDGNWSGSLRRAFCGTRVPFNESYTLADMRDISPGVAFAWARDERGFVVPEIRVDPATKQWLATQAPNKFMHQQWPATTALDWLRLELDQPVDAAIFGWTASAPTLPLSFDPARPAEALPTGIVEKRLAHQPNWIAALVGFTIGLGVWFAAMAFLPLLSDMAPVGRWILTALPLLTLPWWMDVFPQVISHFSRDLGSIVGDVFGDIDTTDRLVASDPALATLANGERLVWRLPDSVYADTFGRFQFAPPKSLIASKEAAFAVLTATVTAKVRGLDEDQQAELFSNLARDKHADLTAVGLVFKPAANEVAADASANVATRRAAKKFLD